METTKKFRYQMRFLVGIGGIIIALIIAGVVFLNRNGYGDVYLFYEAILIVLCLWMVVGIIKNTKMFNQITFNNGMVIFENTVLSTKKEITKSDVRSVYIKTELRANKSRPGQRKTGIADPMLVIVCPQGVEITLLCMDISKDEIRNLVDVLQNQK
ncbi:hypothetical protein KKF81_02580 [Candidatus Micrarchaeota archaeon]|nr:hypothetical protein [Nanoarchaeota archaeon]MBU1165807.1 hypothetical protein [Candidatus Micrarchaeota archaeon]